MSSDNIRRWQKAKEERVAAEKWNSLPEGRKYESSTMAISIAHCNKPMLNRMGQQTCGGTSYWKTEEGFNLAILEHIISDWDTIYPKVIAILESKESKALKECQSYVNDMQKLIDEA